MSGHFDYLIVSFFSKNLVLKFRGVLIHGGSYTQENTVFVLRPTKKKGYT